MVIVYNHTIRSLAKMRVVLFAPYIIVTFVSLRLKIINISEFSSSDPEEK